ncbi:hypothetical protein MRX96_018194 [Rhipicephalus microplus]
MVELHWSRPAEQGLSRTSTQGRGTLGLVAKVALGDQPPAKQATPELIAQYSGDSGVSLLPTAERHFPAAAPRSEAAKWIPQAKTFAGPKTADSPAGEARRSGVGLDPRSNLRTGEERVSCGATAQPPGPPGPPGQTKGAAPYRLSQRPPFLTKGLGQSPWLRAMVELHWSRPAGQGLSRTSTQGRGTLGLVGKAALGDHPPAKQATPELIAQYSGDSGVSLLPTAERHSPAAAPRSEAAKWIPQAKTFAGPKTPRQSCWRGQAVRADAKSRRHDQREPRLYRKHTEGSQNDSVALYPRSKPRKTRRDHGTRPASVHTRREGGAGDASSKVAKGGQSSAPDRLSGVVRDADRVGPDSVSVVSAPEDADAELTEADAPRVSSLTPEDAALPLALESDSPSRRQERGPLAVVRGVIFGVRTCRREVVSPDLGEGAPDDWLSAALVTVSTDEPRAAAV